MSATYPAGDHSGRSRWSTFDKAFLIMVLINGLERVLWLLWPRAHDSNLVRLGLGSVLGLCVGASYALAFVDVFARYPKGKQAGWVFALVILNILGMAAYWLWQRRPLRRLGGPRTSAGASPDRP